MKKICILLLFTIGAMVSVYSQQEVTWKTLSDVKWVPAYFPEYEGYFDMPKFGKEIKKLEGKEIKIKAFYVPMDLAGKYFALSAQPSSMCFFCGGAGFESVMEVITKDGSNKFKRIKTDQYIEVKGTLKLNIKDSEHLMYVLENAEFLRIIK